MRLAILIAASIAAPAAAAQLGQRTEDPAAMLPALGGDRFEAELAAQIAEAERHPLGSLANPVRVGGPDGERAYLARLRCGDGSVPRVGSRREAGVGGFGSVAAAYEVECPGQSEPLRLVFDMYHEEHVEQRAPRGLTITPR